MFSEEPLSYSRFREVRTPGNVVIVFLIQCFVMRGFADLVTLLSSGFSLSVSAHSLDGV